MNISAPFVKRPVAPSLLSMGLLLFGGVAYRSLPMARLPEVEYPTITVFSSLPGASPETVATAIATPLERMFGRIAGITQMTSVSQLGGTYITMQFDLSRDVNGAARDVQAAINAARGQLPANLPTNPNWRKVNPAESDFMNLAVTSDTATRPELYDVAESIVAQKLLQIPGMGQVNIGGGSRPGVRVEMNPLFRAKQYAPLIIAYRNGAPVRLSDVATIVDSQENIRNAGFVDGKPAIILDLFRQPQANIIDTSDRVVALLPMLRASIPPSMHLEVTEDSTRMIRASVRDVQVTLIISVVLVILVVFCFLRSVWATSIPDRKS